MTFIARTTPPSTNSGSLTLSRFVTNTCKLILEVVNRQRLKSTFGKLSARDLRDVGLTENDVTSAQGASLATSASELQREARIARAENW